MFSTDHVGLSHAVSGRAQTVLPETACNFSACRTLMLREVAVVEARRADSWMVHLRCLFLCAYFIT